MLSSTTDIKSSTKVLSELNEHSLCGLDGGFSNQIEHMQRWAVFFAERVENAASK